MSSDLQVNRQVRTRIPTAYGDFDLVLYANNQDKKEHLALVKGDAETSAAPLVRLHSECFTGDVIGSLRCDCGPQLDLAMQRIAQEGAGIVLYLRQEGRGIGLRDKLRAYNLQDEGHDTVDANLLLGHGPDERDYTIGARMLADLGVSTIRLMTNNPEKIASLTQLGITVVARVPLQPDHQEENKDYLLTKANRMGHLLNLNTLNQPNPDPDFNRVNGKNGNGHH